MYIYIYQLLNSICSLCNSSLTKTKWVSGNEVRNAKKYKSKCQHGVCGVNGNEIGMLIGYAVIEPCNLFEIHGIG